MVESVVDDEAMMGVAQYRTHRLRLTHARHLWDSDCVVNIIRMLLAGS